jgi:hypothetical protein
LTVPVVEIRAPVRGTTAAGAPRWVHVVFEAGRHKNESIAIDDPRLSFDRPPGRHLHELKQRFGGACEFRLSRAELAAFRQGCPRARIDDGGDPDVRVLLGTRDECSWELAYALGCLAAANVGRWRPDVRCVATGQIHDGRIRADLVADKLALVRTHAGPVVFLAPLDAADGAAPGRGGPDPLRVVGVSGVAELWENARSPLAAHADLEALGESLRRTFAARTGDIELGARVGAREGPAIFLARSADAPLILRGGSGVGKSCLLAHLALDAADPARSGGELALPPVALRRFDPGAGQGVDALLTCIGEALFEHGAFPEPPRLSHVRALLAAHPALILFDGLDEVADQHRKLLADALDSLLTLWPHHRYVMTDSLSPWFSSARWQISKLLPMTDAQIRALLETRYGAETARRLLARPALRELLRVPLLAALLAESTDPSGALRTQEQVIHGFVQDRLQRWASDAGVTVHGAAVANLVEAARRIAIAFGTRAFTTAEAWRVLDRSPASDPQGHDAVSALVACGFLVDGAGASGTLQFQHDSVRHYFRAGELAPRVRRGRLPLRHRAITDPGNEHWLRYLAVQLAPEPARAIIASVARHSPALGARLADSVADEVAGEPVLASIRRSARLMRALSRPGVQGLAIYVLCMIGGVAMILFPLAFGTSQDSWILLRILVMAVPPAIGIRATRVVGDDNAPFKRLLPLALDLRQDGRVRAVLVSIVRDTAASSWVPPALRSYATTLLAGTTGPQGEPIDAIALLQQAASRGTLLSGILALEHLADPRVAAILAHLLRRNDRFSNAAAKATLARAQRFAGDDFWLPGLNLRALIDKLEPARSNEWGIFGGVAVTLLVLWGLGSWGAVTLSCGLSLVVLIDVRRAAGRRLRGPDMWSDDGPWGYAIILLFPALSTSMFLGYYLPRRRRILSAACGVDWQTLSRDVADAETVLRAQSLHAYRTSVRPG